MLYDNYKSKILMIAKVWETIKRFRILILSCLLAITATVSGLLIAKGAIYGDSECPAEFTYGETLEYGAGAFMGNIRYEYCEVGTDTWSETPPARPGEYKVRAISKGAFGGRREGEEHEFTITARNVLVTVIEEEIVYGDMPTVESDAAETDTVVCTEFAYKGVGTAEIEVAPVADSIVITNADGVDVTECYSVDVDFTPITFKKRPITVTADSVSRNYDGTVLSTNGYELSEGTIAQDDEITVTCNGAITTVGFVVNTPTAQITNADGIDVTQYYDIKTVNGTLSVGQRPVLIESASAEQIYNATAFFNTEFNEDNANAQLVLGHRIEVVGGAQITDVGSVQNTLTVKIFDAAENDVTANYAISYPESSVLKVLPRPITVVSHSDTHVYDGTPFTKTGYMLADDTSLVFGEQLYGTYTGSITNVGTAENTFTVREILNNGRNVTHNYEITLVFGTLEVTPRPVTITTETESKEYDGEKFSATNSTADNLVLGHSLKMIDFTEITYVSENRENNNVAVYEIINSAEEDVSDNYTISYNYGTLTIKPRQIEISIVDKEKVYDGTHLESAETRVTCVDGREWPTGHSLSVGTRGSQTNVGTSENVFSVNADGQIAMIVNRSTHSIETNFAENFEVVGTTNGLLTVTPRQVLLTSSSADFVYADTPYMLDEISISDERTLDDGTRVYPLVAGHTAETNGWGEIIDVGVLENSFTAIIRDAEQNDVSYNYAIRCEAGTVRVHKRKVKIQVHSYTWIYDGTQHYDGDGTENVYGQSHEYTFDDCVEEWVTNDIDSFHKPVEGHTLFIISPSFYRNVTYKQLGNGEYDYDEIVGYQNEVVFAIRKNGLAQGNNYEISYIDGTVTILPRPLSLLSGSDSKIYDGTALTCESCGFVSGSLALNQQIEISYTGSQTNAYSDENAEYGESENTYTVIIWNENYEDVTVNYDLDLQYGTLTVYPRPILVNRHNYSVMYDGEAHYDDWAYYGSDLTEIENEYYSLVNGHAFQLAGYTNTVTNVADSGTANDVTLKIVQGDPFSMDAPDVTRNYTIEYQGGSLSITKRPIKIITRTLYWTFDGETHWDTESYTAQNLYVDNISYYPLVSGHWLNATGQLQIWGANANPQTGEIFRTHKNEISFAVIGNEEGTNDNYAIAVEYGDLIVWQREIGIVARSAEKVYDDTPLTVETGEWTYRSDSRYELVEGHTLTVTTSGAKRTDVGTTENTIVLDSALILDSQNGDVTNNYLISYQDGSVIITPRLLFINPHAHTWVYDANAHHDECTYTNADLNVSTTADYQTYYLVDGHSFITTNHTEITNVGTKTNDIKFNVADKNGRDVTSNYDFWVNNTGILTVTPRPVHLETFDGTWVYDNEWHTNKNIRVEHNGVDSGLIGGRHNFRVETWGEIKDVGTVDNHITISIWDEYGEVTENYQFIEEVVGRLEVTARPIYINVHSHTDWVYDGYAHSDGCQYTNADLYVGELNGTSYTELVSGHNLTQTERSTITNAGEVQNVLQFIVKDETGELVTNNYLIVCNDETAVLKINPREIIINLHDCEWIYDGQEHSDGDGMGLNGTSNAYTQFDVSDLGYSLPDNHLIVIVGANTIENFNNTFVANETTVQILNGAGEWIEENFLIGYQGGSLTVLPREIMFVSADDGKIYDGQPLTNSTVSVYWVMEQLEGHEVIGAYANGSQTEIGASFNTIADGYQIVDADGTLVTGNYYVNKRLGWLTVYDPNEVQRINMVVQPKYTEGVYPGASSVTHSGEIIEWYLQDLIDSGYTYEVEMSNVTQVGLGSQTVSISYFAMYDVNGSLIAEYDNGEWLKESYLYNFILEENKVRLCAKFELFVASLTGVYPETQSLTHTGEVVAGFNVELMLQKGYTYEVEVEEKELIGRGMVNVRIKNFTLYDPNGATVAVYENFDWVQTHEDYDIHLYDGCLQIATQIVIQPISMEGKYPEVEILTHTGEIEHSDMLETLVNEGYTYELDIEEAQQIGVGVTEVNVKSFKLLQPDGTLAIHYEPEINEWFIYENMYILVLNSGTLRITEQLVTIHLAEKTKVYDGTPLAYDDTDEWWTVAKNRETGKYEEVDLSNTVRVEIDFMGMPTVRNIDDVFNVNIAKTCVTVYSVETGEDLTSQYTIEFDTIVFEIYQREVRLSSGSADKKYDGTPLTAHEIIFKKGGIDGHTATAEFTAELINAGALENKVDVETVRIFNEYGEDVTRNFKFDKVNSGWLTITNE